MFVEKAGYCLGAAALALVLTGCKSDGVDATLTGSTGAPVALSKDAVLAKQKDSTGKEVVYDVNDALDPAKGNATLSTSNVTSSTVLNDFTKKTTSAQDPAKFSIKRNSDGSVAVTLNGVTETYTKADLVKIDAAGPLSEANATGYRKTSGGSDHEVDTYTARNLADLSQGKVATKYANVWEYFWTDDDKRQMGYAVVGTETDPKDLAALPVATYKGGAAADIFDAEGPSNVRTKVSGDLGLTANFAAKTVSGSITNLTTGDRGPAGNGLPDVAVPGTINLNKTAISANGYSGSLSLDAAGRNTFAVKDTSGSTYSGRFYGPAADETAGVLNIRVNKTDGSASIGTGQFSGTKQ